MITVYSSKRPGETVTLAFDFTAELGGATINTKACAASVLTGADAAASSMISGTAQESAGVVLQLVQGGVHGVDYIVEATAVLSDGRTLKLPAVLPVRLPLIPFP